MRNEDHVRRILLERERSFAMKFVFLQNGNLAAEIVFMKMEIVFQRASRCRLFDSLVRVCLRVMNENLSGQNVANKMG